MTVYFKKFNKQWLIVMLVGFVSACAHQSEPKFEWGQYEDLVYKSYLKPQSALPRDQIEKLTSDILKANERGQVIAPGLYAHLGYMYYLRRDLRAARSAFETELSLYPESEVFIQRLINTIDKQGAE